jgi:hypothetical protein
VNTAEANRMQERRYRGREASRASNRQLFIQRNRVAINGKNKAEGEECDKRVASPDGRTALSKPQNSPSVGERSGR